MRLTTGLVKLPFPITIKFKSMLQSGVMTKDMDPRWMSSISWYFLCIFGLQSVFNFLLGSDNGKPCPCCPSFSLSTPPTVFPAANRCVAANQMAQQMGQMGPQAPQMFAPGQDPDKQFQAEAENLAVVDHYSVLDGVEGRLLESIKA